jgi:hypothetical protein
LKGTPAAFAAASKLASTSLAYTAQFLAFARLLLHQRGGAWSRRHRRQGLGDEAGDRRTQLLRQFDADLDGAFGQRAAVDRNE